MLVDGDSEGLCDLPGVTQPQGPGKGGPGVAWLEVPAGHVLESVVRVGAWTHARVSLPFRADSKESQSSFLLEGTSSGRE